jgi:hypothetical protein
MSHVNPEIGRELSAAELVVKTVVILGRDDRPNMFTTWVHSIGQDSIAFWSGEGGCLLLLYLREDGKLCDDSGVEIHVYEYLGVI